jgi:hypothetical protein
MNDLLAGGRVGPSSSAPSRHKHGFFMRLCTANPFYAISAVLVFVGLRVSFNTQAAVFPSWALLAGLAGYTLLLAGMAVLLVRFGNVWDDIRTLLVLVVLMFLVISVAFDEIFSRDPTQGVACCLGGLAFAVVLSEALLRGLRLSLPAWFRLPYHLALGLFFLYPAAISPLLRSPTDPALLWALFGFSPAAGLVALTLIPAIRRGRDYVRDNGSPWPWPLYPWVLFGVLGFGACARSYYLCLSAQYSSYPDRYDSLLSSIFGTYFLVPFFLGVNVLLLEAGMVTRNARLRNLALVMPAALVALTLVGHQPFPVYRKFLDLFVGGIGGTPAYVTLIAVAVFYAVAALRRVPHAWDGLTATFVALGVVGPGTLTLDRIDVLHPAPMAIAGLLQLALALRRGGSSRALLATAGLAVALMSSGIAAGWTPPIRTVVAYHIAIAATMILGAVYDDPLARVLRPLGALLLLAASQMAIFGDPDLGPQVGPGAIRMYPVVLGVIALTYGRFFRSVPYLAAACFSLLGGLVVVSWRGYGALRRLIAGLDQIAWGLLSFGVAAVISLWKAGAIRAWSDRRRGDRLAAATKPYPPEGLGEPL